MSNSFDDIVKIATGLLKLDLLEPKRTEIIKLLIEVASDDGCRLWDDVKKTIKDVSATIADVSPNIALHALLFVSLSIFKDSGEGKDSCQDICGDSLDDFVVNEEAFTSKGVN